MSFFRKNKQLENRMDDLESMFMRWAKTVELNLELIEKERIAWCSKVDERNNQHHITMEKFADAILEIVKGNPQE